MDLCSDPFPIAEIVTSYAYSGPDDQFVGDTGFLIHGHAGGYNLIYCNVTVFDIDYRYTSSASSTIGTFEAINAVPSDLTTTFRIASTVEFGISMNYVPQRVEGTGIKSGSYVDAYALELSRELIALSALIWEPAPASEVSAYEQVLGSKINVVPLALFVATVLSFALLTIWIGVVALWETRAMSFVHLAHVRLTSPLAYTHALYGPVEPSRTWTQDGLGVFSAETEADRLNVGPVLTARGDEAFGVVRGHEGKRVDG